MRTPAEVAAMLVAGTLDRRRWPELDEEEFASQVRERLATVDLELIGSGGRWLARPSTAPDPNLDGFEPTFSLHAVELAVVAALYLHLRYLPRQATEEARAEEPSMEVDELLRGFPGHNRTYIEKIVLGHLRNAGFVRRENDRLYAGPYLGALNEIEADARAQEALGGFALRRYLQRRAQELEAEHAPD